MLATFCVPRGMSWQDSIVARADITCLVRRGARRGRNEPARLLRLFRLVRATQRLRLGRMASTANQPGMSGSDDTSSAD